MNNFKRSTCNACGGFIEPKLVLENFRDGWHIVRCPQCQLTFVDPIPPLEIISSYYNGMYTKLSTEYNEQKMQWARNSIRGYLSLLRKHIRLNEKSLLDLGGGLGYYSKAFEEAGFTVTFVEQDLVSAKFAREVLKIKNTIECNSEQFFSGNDKEYEIVFLRHVIEHSVSPGVLVTDVAKCLSNGGILIIETNNNAGIEPLFKPNTAKFYLNLYRTAYTPSSLSSLLIKRPFAVDPPRHLFGFRISNLSELLQRNSLIPCETKCYRLGHPIYWPNLPSPTLMHLLNNARNWKIKRVIANMMDIIILPFRIFLEYVGLASGICIYARKVISE